MKSTDKLLVGIVVVIVLLVVVAFVIVLTRPEATYVSDDTPEGVTHNYLLALQKGEYDQAWEYISDTLPGYPDSAEDFSRQVRAFSWQFRLDDDVSLAIVGSEIRGGLTVVRVREARFYGGDLFDSGQRQDTFQLELQLADGEWKIVDADYYFSPCWTDPGGYRCTD